MTDWAIDDLAGALSFREGPGIMAVDFREEGVPLIRLAGLKRGAHVLDGCDFLAPAMVEQRWKRFRLRAGDVLLSTSASLGEVAVVPPQADGAIPYTGIIAFRPADQRIDPSFVAWMLRDSMFASQVEAMGAGSVMKHFGPSHLRQMRVRFPDLATQRAIAEVLGALDDKIAANADLVTVADDLVSLEFARLTADHPDDTALTDIADFVNGRAFTKEASGAGRVVIRIAELNSGIGNSTVFSDAAVPEVHVAQPGDVLFAWSGSLTVHRWFLPEAIVNQHIFKVIPKNGWPRWAVHRALAQRLPYFKAVAADRATTMGHIQRRHLEETLRLPTAKSIGQADQTIDPIWRRALAAEMESETLAELRDKLLPKLMSGELRVKDAEREIGEVL